jgi:hypothetical protein
MRMLKLFALVAVLGLSTAAFTGEKDTTTTSPKPADEPRVTPTGTVTGTIHPPSKEAPRGAVAELHQAAPAGDKGGDIVFFLFADGKESRTLRDLANRGGSATVTGEVTEKGYRVTSVSNAQKSTK